jgi:hypothetical protein
MKRILREASFLQALTKSIRTADETASQFNGRCRIAEALKPSQRHAVIPPIHSQENEMAHPATKKRGGNPDVKHKPERQRPKDAMERKLEQGLEESMAGSDPVSVTQPSQSKHHEEKEG